MSLHSWENSCGAVRKVLPSRHVYSQASAAPSPLETPLPIAAVRPRGRSGWPRDPRGGQGFSDSSGCKVVEEIR
eukprot:752240-Hanusia_phi.AAC.1